MPDPNEELPGRGAPVVLPNLSRPVPAPPPHPAAGHLEDFLLQRMRHFGMIRTEKQARMARRAQLGVLTAMVYPAGPVDRLEVLAELIAYYIHYEEAGFELPSTEGAPAESARNMLRWHRIMEDPYHPQGKDNPYERAWRDAQRRLRQFASPSQVERFNTALSRQMVGAATEIIYSQARVSPELEDYVYLRRLSSAVGSGYCLLAEVVGEYEVAPETWFRLDVQRYVNLVNELTGIRNDLAAVWRDASTNRLVIMNVVAAIAGEHSLTPATALDRGVLRYNDCQARLQAMASDLHGLGDRSLSRLLADMELFIAGFDEWHSISPRHYELDEFSLRG